MKDIEKVVQFCEKIARDDTHGYSQINRNGNPDYDCSSLISHALIYGGFKVNKDSYTGNLYSQLKKEGFKEVKAPFKRGDIHLKPYHHINISTDASHVVNATYDEDKGVKGTKKGDQTGHEIEIKKYSDFGAKYHLRYEPSKTSTKTSTTKVEFYTQPHIYKALKDNIKVYKYPNKNREEYKGKNKVLKGYKYTIVNISLKDGIYYGQLKSGIGYVILNKKEWSK